jgi:hypothetical protein
MPFGWLIGSAVWGYFVACHQIARALVGGFDSPGTSVAWAVMGSIVGALPLIALLPVALLPQWWFGRRQPERRVAAARCPDCGYPRTAFPCPECGGDGRVAPLDLFARRPIAWLLSGTTVVFVLAVWWAEFRIHRDESAFRQEIDQRLAAGLREPFSRPRAEWGSFATLHYDPASGFSAPPPFDHHRIPGWRATGRPAPVAP